VSFWTGSQETCDEQSTFAVQIIFFLNIYFQDFRVKNYLILYVKQSKLASESSVSCIKQGSEMSNFCLEQGWGLKALAAQVYPNFPCWPLFTCSDVLDVPLSSSRLMGATVRPLKQCVQICPCSWIFYASTLLGLLLKLYLMR